MLQALTSKNLNPITYEARPNPHGGYAVFGVCHDRKTGKEISVAPIKGYPTLEQAQQAAAEIAKIAAPPPAQKIKHKPLPLPARKEIQAKLITCTEEYAAAFYEHTYVGHVIQNLLTDWLDETVKLFGEFQHPAIVKRRENAARDADRFLDDVYDNRVSKTKRGEQEYSDWAVSSYDIMDIIVNLVCFSRTAGGDTGLIAAVKNTINQAVSDETRQRIRKQNAQGVQVLMAKDLGWLSKDEEKYVNETLEKAINDED